MPNSIALYREPLAASEDEIRELERIIAFYDDGHAPTLAGPSGEAVELPQVASVLLRRLMHSLAAGNAVSLIPVPPELTLEYAADLLNVSKQHIIQLVEQGELGSHMDGTMHRIRLDDLLKYKRCRDAEYSKGAAGLARLSEEMGLYDVPEPDIREQ